MNILYVKRACNTRLHTQIHALSNRGHSIVLLLEAPIEDGYNGPGQWADREIRSRFPVVYTSSGTGRARRAFGASLIARARKWLREPGPGRGRQGFGPREEHRYLKTMDQVLSKYRVDLVFSGNDALPDEDRRTRLLLDRFGGKVPIVYDCQDILSDCFQGDREIEENERAVHEIADGVIHTNPLALKWAASRYRFKKGYAFPNYASGAFFPEKQTKLSSRDGRIHLVYSGGVQQTPPGHEHPYARDMKKRFMEIASLGHPLHLHLGQYPGSPIQDYYQELDKSPDIRIHPYRSFREMMRTLSRYDVGLFPLDLSHLDRRIEAEGPRVLDQSRFSRIDTSKQYEYTLAGLPVMTVPVRWVTDWLTENRFGTSFATIEDLGKVLESDRLGVYVDTVSKTAARFTIENRIGGLERFLSDVLGNRSGEDTGEGA
jgi:hypothetical protein